MKTETSYELFFMTSQSAGHAGTIWCLTAFALFNRVDWSSPIACARKTGVDLEIPPSFSSKEEAIQWYGEYQKKVKVFIEDYNKKNKGFFKTQLSYTLPEEIYIIEKVIYK